MADLSVFRQKSVGVPMMTDVTDACDATQPHIIWTFCAECEHFSGQLIHGSGDRLSAVDLLLQFQSCSVMRPGRFGRRGRLSGVGNNE